MRAIRYLSTNDAFRDSRDAFLEGLFPDIAIRTFADDETHMLSRAWGDYDTLIIGGNDPGRIGRFLRLNRALLAMTAKIALVPNSTPSRRARLLNYGFDDVLDNLRMSPEEARIRVQVVLDRYASSRYRDSLRRQRTAFLERYCHPAQLTPREFAVLFVLANNIEQQTAASQIARVVQPQDIVTFKRSLKVIISNIRKKLYHGFRIESDHAGGYRLVGQDACAMGGDTIRPMIAP